MRPIRILSSSPIALAIAFLSGSAPAHVIAPGTGTSVQSTAPLHPPGGSAPAPVPRVLPVRFAVIGDYGVATAGEATVAALVKSFHPEFVITAGDNNYPDGSADTIDEHIGQYYHEFIHPYTGTYGNGAARNRFFPALGNHDWLQAGAAPYLAYFSLPGNERYYEFVRGPVHFFAIDSDGAEPHGITSTSVQASWLQARLAASTAPFKLVYFHHPPYTSAEHESDPNLQWPFRAWGADVVIAGHDHSYERIVRDGFPYYVNGLGGNGMYSFLTPVAGSAVRFNADFGAMVVDATEDVATLRFVTSSGIEMDTMSITPTGVDYDDVALVPSGSTWRYLDDGTNQGTAWRAPTFNDAAWAQGPAELGYGDGDEATVVGFGPNPNNKYITTYFRKSFQVTDLASIRALSIEIVRDDGAAVYLNGTEVYRTNMPATAIGFTTPATLNVNAPLEAAWYGTDVSPSLLVAGTNVLAVELHQRAVNTSDASFDARVTARMQGQVLCPFGAVWKYRDSGIDPGATWVRPDYDDSAWSSGPAQLGYGDGDEATVVGYGPDPNAKYTTTWFRTTFTASGVSAISGLLARLVYDDGVAVYLNGREMLRWNLPYASLAPTDLAAFNVSGAQESALVETLIDPTALVEGTNVLAVEVHQQAPTSSDVSFDLELVVP